MYVARIRSRLNMMVREPSRFRRGVANRLQVLVAHWDGLHELRWRLRSRQDVFVQVYESEAWGSRESGSGTGSELRATANIRERLPALLSRLGAESLLDAPCGDRNWMQHVELPVKQYYGVDIVPRLIEVNRIRFGSERHHFSLADRLPEPIEMISDGGEVDPNQLGLWRLQDLPQMQEYAAAARPVRSAASGGWSR